MPGLQLNQVFMNLLVNAAHAMGRERGTITIRTRTLGETVCLEFADNGCGIPDDIRDRIFRPFFSPPPVGKGTGLGLSLACGIIQTTMVRSTWKAPSGKAPPSASPSGPTSKAVDRLHHFNESAS